jgi:hypothetical protein
MAPHNEKRVNKLVDANRDALTGFVFAELSLALTFCKIAKNSSDDVNRQRRSLKIARKAYENAQRYIFDLKIEHPAFDQMVAEAEFLKFELERLGH